MRVRPKRSSGPSLRFRASQWVSWCFSMFAAQGCMTSYVVSAASSSGEGESELSTKATTQTLSSTKDDSSSQSESSSKTKQDGSSSPDATESTTTDSGASSTSSDITDTLPACPGKKIRCGLLCVDVRNDAQHCGGCFVGCAAPASCIGGQCLRSCDEGCSADEECNIEQLCACKDAKTHCGAECVDLGSSVAHCGACGRVCGPAQTCLAGQCRS